MTNDKFSYFESFIGRLDSENVEYYLLGDLNCDLGASVLDHNSRSLTDIADLYGMHQLINEPTRITESSSTISITFLRHCVFSACKIVMHVEVSAYAPSPTSS